MTLKTQALDPFSEVVDKERRWVPEWYTFISTVNRVGTVADLPTDRVDPVTGQPIKVVGVGERAFVTDSSVTAFGAILVGGGASRVPVYYDGVGWRIG